MKRITLDVARAHWEDDPCGSTAAEYRRVARGYHAEGVIDDDTLERILAETVAYVVGAGRRTP